MTVVVAVFNYNYSDLVNSNRIGVQSTRCDEDKTIQQIFYIKTTYLCQSYINEDSTSWKYQKFLNPSSQIEFTLEMKQLFLEVL